MRTEIVYKIGIDVGEENTVAVIVDENHKIIAKTIQPNTDEIDWEIFTVLSDLIQKSQIDVSLISSVVLASNRCLNSIKQRKNLTKIAALRLALPSNKYIPALSNCSQDIQGIFADHLYMLEGGNEFDGSEIKPLEENRIYEIAHKLNGDIHALAITGVFSNVNNTQEIRAREIIREVMGDNVHVSLSHQIADLGILGRENATILNAALNEIAIQIGEGFLNSMNRLGIKSNMYIAANNGTSIPLVKAMNIPILTLFGGQANNICGASALENLAKAIVLDVGDAITVGGVFENDSPVLSSSTIDLGGVPANIIIPELVLAEIGLNGVNAITNDIIEGVEYLIDLLKTSNEDIPIILTGKLAKKLELILKEKFQMIVSDNYEYASAYGAAISQLSKEN